VRRRLTGILVSVAVVALGVLLWRWSAPDAQDRGLFGGPLFTFAPEDVVRLDVRRVDGTARLVREDDGWRLEGQVSDLVDTSRMDHALRSFTPGQGFAVLPGTEPDARRFGFGTERSVELVFHLRGGGRHRLAVGDLAPVSDQVYASGAGRSGVFGVTSGYYAAVVGMPDAVRLARLLPPRRLDDLIAIELGRRGAPAWRFERRDDGRWWLRLPDGQSDLMGLAADYHLRFDDRRRADDGDTWVQADPDRLGDLVFRVTDTAVRGFVPASEQTEALLEDHGLQPAYRTVALIESDRRWDVALGEAQADQAVLARREGALVITRLEALLPAEGSLSEFLDLGALGFRLAGADSIRIDQPDRPHLRGRRVPPPEIRSQAYHCPWRAVAPPGWVFTSSVEAASDHLFDVQVALDRLAMRRLLDTAANDPLAGPERWRVRSWFPDGAMREFWLGRHGQAGVPVLWDTSTGRVAVIDQEILVTLRNLRHDLRARP